MKKSVRSPGSATVINAIATGFGAAFGIGLDIKCCANTQNSSITCSNQNCRWHQDYQAAVHYLMLL